MFDFFRKHTRVLQFLLVLLIFPSFIVFGIQGYNRFSDGANAAVAKVDGRDITQAEWDAAHREQVQRAQRQSPNLDVRLLDTPQMKQIALESAVRERVLMAAADDAHFSVSDDRLERLFKSDPQFAMIRNPDGSVNKQFLAMQGMTSENFAQRLRQDMSVRQVVQGLASTAIAPSSAASGAFDALLQRREIQVQRFDAKTYAAKVSPTDADLEKYYADPAHAAQFKVPESASVELLVLDVEALKKTISVPEDDLRKYYTENLKLRYTVPEERRASHIHVQVDRSAAKDVRDKARARAEALLAEVRKNPAAFAEVAKKSSDDAGSSERGGDLDFFVKGGVGDKAFDDAAFALKPGEISDLVDSDDGYHIIKLTDVRGGQTRSFDTVRSEIEDEVRKQLALKKFSESAVDFTNTVYEQAESLQPAADKFKLPIVKAEKVSRTPLPGQTGALANPKFLEALFSPDSIAKKRNTDAIEVGPNQLASGRLVQYAAARQPALAEVRDKVRERVAAEQSTALARKDGEARVAELQKDPKAALAGPTLTVSRNQPANLPRSIVDLALRSDAGKLPSAAGVELPGEGYAVVRVTAVLPRDPALEAATLAPQYAQVWGEAELTAYYEALKTRYKVDMKGHTAAAAAASAPAPN